MWSNMEDMGIALGFFVSRVFNLYLEDIKETDTSWKCEEQATYAFLNRVTDKEYSIERKWW